MTYLVSEYATDDSLYPKDVKVRALVDQRIQFDLGTLYARMYDYFVSSFLTFLIYPLKSNKIYEKKSIEVPHNVAGCAFG